jgi:hypothetical protein
MNSSEMFDDFELEKLIKEQFGVILDVDTVIARRISVGSGGHATVFLTNKKQLYCYVAGPARLLLSDIRKIMTRMGLKADQYFPPKGQPHYFDDVARQKFRDVFPGRRDARDDDLAFYRTLAPYCPALISISEVKGGTIYCADHDASTGWRPAAKFAYRRIKTS